MWFLMAFSGILREEMVDLGIPTGRSAWENDQITLH